MNTELILALQFSEVLDALKLKWDTTAPAVGLVTCRSMCN